jgi:catechol 2,3-dioxygenase-like lactoylglutathione lyase family enzyme
VSDQRTLDVAIVVRSIDHTLAFYTDVLGLEHRGTIPVPGGTIHRLGWGDSELKLVATSRVPAAGNPPGGPRGATGIRYVTLNVELVALLDDVVARCEAAGATVPVARTEAPGVVWAMVEDPEGNWVELVHHVELGA